MLWLSVVWNVRGYVKMMLWFAEVYIRMQDLRKAGTKSPIECKCRPLGRRTRDPTRVQDDRSVAEQ